MKVRSSVKPICEKCKIIRRKGSIRVICDATDVLCNYQAADSMTRQEVCGAV